MNHNGDWLQSYVEWKSVQFFRVANRYYINANQKSYQLTPTEAEELHDRIEKETDTPLTAAFYILSQLHLYQCITKE